MLIILTVCLVIASVFILFLKKSRESVYLFGLCLSLMLEICGVMLFIAKKGGISPEIITFLYFSKDIKNRLQYFLITLNQMGYMIALGRTLFPYFLIKLAMNYSMIPVIRKKGLAFQTGRGPACNNPDFILSATVSFYYIKETCCSGCHNICKPFLD